MNLVLSFQRFLALGDGVIRGCSSKDHLADGSHYWVRPLDGPPKIGTFVIAVARRDWMGSKKRLVKNFIVKRVESIEVSLYSKKCVHSHIIYSPTRYSFCKLFPTGRWPCQSSWD